MRMWSIKENLKQNSMRTLPLSMALLRLTALIVEALSLSFLYPSALCTRLLIIVDEKPTIIETLTIA